MTTAQQIIRFAIPLLAALVADDVSADYFNSPGLECVEIGDSVPETYYRFGDARNDNATYAAEYACPIIRRSPDSSEISGSIAVIDDSNSDDVACKIISCYSDGDCRGAPSNESTGTGSQWISLVPMDGYLDGYAYIHCTIPAGFSGIWSYYIDD